jgi:hypothetical protein
MSKADLSNALISAGGGVRRKQSPPPSLDRAQSAEATPKHGRVGTSPITVHFPSEVRDQLKIMAVEQRITMQQLIAEAFNDLFAKHGRPEIAPVGRGSLS